MDKKLKPIIKWTGGKFKEFALFADEIPNFNRYIEPFFGGGGVFFALQPKGKSFINDKSADLINFYREIQNPKLKEELLHYATAWTELSGINSALHAQCFVAFKQYVNGEAKLSVLNEKLTACLPDIFEHSQFIDPLFVISFSALKAKVMASMLDKASRISLICQKERKTFSDQQLANHFETGLRSGVYLYFRTILNLNFNQQLQLDAAKVAANWYFVRELCYGSMFRFNNKGEFNIPYGGISYNRKNLKKKIQRMFSPAIASLFKDTTIENGDFEEFLKEIDLVETDFVFLDPPYDSEFSEYDQHAFTKDDQLRLANFLIATPAKWMVVIKETPFIKQIYTHKRVKIKLFSKNYAYNMRGRNDRNVNHLIIKNF